MNQNINFSRSISTGLTSSLRCSTCGQIYRRYANDQYGLGKKVLPEPKSNYSVSITPKCLDCGQEIQGVYDPQSRLNNKGQKIESRYRNNYNNGYNDSPFMGSSQKGYESPFINHQKENAPTPLYKSVYFPEKKMDKVTQKRQHEEYLSLADSYLRKSLKMRIKPNHPLQPDQFSNVNKVGYMRPPSNISFREASQRLLQPVIYKNNQSTVYPTRGLELELSNFQPGRMRHFGEKTLAFSSRRALLGVNQKRRVENPKDIARVLETAQEKSINNLKYERMFY